MTRCPSCGSNCISLIGDIPASYTFASQVMDHLLPGGRLWKCSDCHLHFRWPHISESRRNQIYKQGYATQWEYDLEDRIDWQLAIEFIEQNNVSGKVLDVGCFGGGLLRHISDRWDKYGIEINSFAAKRAEERGIKTFEEDWQCLDNVQQEFDIVIAMDMIEHVGNPAQFLTSLTQALKRKGFLVVSTGNTDAPSWRLMRSRYWYCAIPEHISFINPTWCYRTVEDLNLSVVQIRSFSHYGKFTVRRGIVEILSNLLYRFSPGTWAFLRQFHKKYLVAHYGARFNKLDPYPAWKTARDHIFVVFQRH